MAEGGDVFVLDMGQPVKIRDLARRMINLMGLTVRDETNPDGDIFRANFVADGTELAPVVIGGIRFLVSDAFTLGGEVRWHKATGDTGGISQGFLGDKIDLGGLTTNFSFGFRF